MSEKFRPISRDEMRAQRQEKGYLCRNQCPFCDHEKHKENGSYMTETDQRMLIHNLAPYNKITGHLIAFTKNHVEKTLDFSPEQSYDFYENMLPKIEAYYKDQIFSRITRETFGQSRTVGHFHTHFLPGKFAFFEKDFDWIFDENQESIVHKKEQILLEHLSENYKSHSIFAQYSNADIKNYHLQNEGNILLEWPHWKIIQENSLQNTQDKHLIVLHKNGIHSYSELPREHITQLAEVYEFVREYFANRSFEKQRAQNRDIPPKWEDEEQLSTQGNWFSFTRWGQTSPLELHFLAGEPHFDSDTGKFVWLHDGESKPAKFR